MSNSIQGDGANEIRRINSQKDIEQMKQSGQEVKNSAQLNSIFNKLDKNGDGILQEEEGSLYYFKDGTISGMKDGKMVSGATAGGMLVDVDENGNKKTTSYNDGAKSEYVYNSNNEVQYKKYIKDGKEYLLSSNNRKMATVEKDGSLRTSFRVGDSFEGTLIRLGLDPSDAEIRQVMEEANPNAAKRGYFTLDDNGDNGTQVAIPKSVLEKYDIKFNGPELRLAPKASEQYAKEMEKSSWTSAEVQEGIPDPFKKQ